MTTLKTEKQQREQRVEKKQNRISKDHGTLQMV